MPRKQSEPHRTEDLHYRLIQAAIDLMQTEAISQLSLRAVAKRLDISHNAPYKHFQNKDALLAAVSEEGFRMLHQSLEAYLQQAPSDPLQQLQDIGIGYIQFAWEHPNLFRLMFGAYRTTPPPTPGPEEAVGATLSTLIEGFTRRAENGTPELTAKGQAFMVLVNVVNCCQQQGVMRADDPKQIALACWSIVHGLAMLLLDGQILTPAPQFVSQLATMATKLLVEGLAVKVFP